MVGADVEPPVLELDELTILELNKAMVGADVEHPVFELDEALGWYCFLN